MELMSAHRQWADRPTDERFEELSTMYDALNAIKNASTETDPIGIDNFIATVSDQSVEIAHKQGLTPGRLTHWSLSQLCNLISVPRRLLSLISNTNATNVMNDRMSQTTDTPRILWDSASPGNPRVRAFHGSAYERLWSADVVKAVQTYLPKHWKNPVAYRNGEWGAHLVPSGLYASDRDMFAFLVDGGDCLEVGEARLHRGTIVANSEVGDKSFWWLDFWFNQTCGNHIIWGAQKVKMNRARHVNGINDKFSDFKNYLMDLNDPDPVGGLMAQTVLDAHNTSLVTVNGAAPTDQDIKLLMDLGFKRGEITAAREAIIKEEISPRGTVWDWVQGFTAIARTIPHTDTRINLEKRAGMLLKGF